MIHLTIEELEELFEEYGNLAWMYHECVSDEAKEQRMAEIIQEVETLVRKETIEEIDKMGLEPREVLVNYAQSKGITLGKEIDSFFTNLLK